MVNNINPRGRVNIQVQHPAVIDAVPKGYTIDIRVFLVVITVTMALAFTVGAMIGPLGFLNVPFPEMHYSHDAKAFKSSTYSNSHQIEAAPARKVAEGIHIQGGGGGSNSSKKAREIVISANGDMEVVGESIGMIKQPKRTPTDHVATLGYKIKEVHVNVGDTPVLEGRGNGDISRHEKTYRGVEGEEPLLRDQTNPSGQHLLVDIRNLEAAFLNSESRLANAMQESVKAGGLTMLSYHCHSLHPAGVSCVGVLLESHISFHTWPDEGVITLDLFTTSENPLLPLLPKIEKLFGIPRIDPNTGLEMEAVTVWSHELRGFRTEDDRKAHHLDGQSDLSNWVTSPLEVVYKKQIVGVQTQHQRIDIWDVRERDETPSYNDGKVLGMKPDDPRWLSNEHASPTRLFFLNGALQTISKHEREFHESLVQPAMFAHPSPKTVAIIGGGEGATLREALRHKSVQKVVMIELDEKVVEVSKEFMPELSNCTDIIDSVPSCFDDPRATLIIADAFEYIVDRQIKGEFDVLIVDAMNHEEHDEFASSDMINALVNSLTPNGVVAVQIGVAPSILDPRADKGMNRKRESLINILEYNPDISSIHIYEEAHCGYWEPRAFLVACRDDGCRKNWYAETDEVDYLVYDRIGGTRSGERSLVHFDGATQRSFHAPPRAWETIYCLREPMPFECAYRGLDIDKGLFEYTPENEETSAFDIRATKTMGDNGEVEDGARVYAKVDIPAGSYIMPTHLAASFEVSDDSMENISGEPTAEIDGVGRPVVIDDFIEFIGLYGHPSIQVGSGKNFVEIGGTFLIRTADNVNEANIRRWIPTHPDGGRPKYSPVYDRHRHSFDVFVVASRDIKAGEEIVKPPALWKL